MSSSLLLVLIVVVWLFVLAPLVVNTRQPIRRTSEALGRTRLLHQGGESVATRRRRPVLTERDVRAPGEEVDESLETVDAELDDPRDDLDDAILIDDTEDGAGDLYARGGLSRLGRRVRGGDGAGAGDGAAADEVPAVVDGDIVYELEAGADAGADAVADAETDSEADGEAGADGGAVVDDAADSSHDDADLAAEVSSTRAAAAKAIADAPAEDARAYLTPEDFLVIDGETSAEQSAAAADDADADDAEAAETTAAAEAAEAGADADAVAETDDDLVLADNADDDAGPGAHDADFAKLDDTLTDDDLAFAERRRGRGGFDPVSDARYAETRFARRRRSVGVLAGLIVLGVILGVVVGGWTWWLPLAGTGLMVLYLVYLRRTVIAEKELRARRIRRMKMARMGVRNSEDEELGIPERLRRPGAVVVELDDEDPDFADLPYVTHEFPEEDIRRAAGQ